MKVELTPQELTLVSNWIDTRVSRTTDEMRAKGVLLTAFANALDTPLSPEPERSVPPSPPDVGHPETQPDEAVEEPQA